MSKTKHIGHRFAVAVDAKLPFDPLDPKPYSKIVRQMDVVAGILEQGYTHLRLIRPDNSMTSYFYDKAASRKKQLIRAAAVFAGAFGIVYACIPMTQSRLAAFGGVMAMWIAPIASAMHGRGRVKKINGEWRMSHSIQFPITPRQYERLSAELNGLSAKKTHGLYSLPFNNCTTFAVRFCEKHSFGLPQLSYISPVTLKTALIVESARRRAPTASPQ